MLLRPLPLVSKWLVRRPSARRTHLPASLAAKSLSQSKWDYVVGRDPWANLSCCWHPPGSCPNLADTRPLLTEKLSAAALPVPLHHIRMLGAGAGDCPVQLSHQCSLAFMPHIFFKAFTILYYAYPTSSHPSLPLPTHVLGSNSVFSFFSVSFTEVQHWLDYSI